MDDIEQDSMSVGSDDDNQQQPAQPPTKPVLVRYEVANNIFEIPERYKLMYAIGQGAYGIVWCVYT